MMLVYLWFPQKQSGNESNTAIAASEEVEEKFLICTASQSAKIN